MGSFFISVILYSVLIVNSDSSTARNLNLNFTFQLRKCCPKGSVYRHFLDICSPSLENKVSTLNITFINQQEFNESVTFKITESQGLDDCPDGFIGTTQEEFSVFNNGSAQVTTKDDILVVDWNDYCIDYVQRTNQSLKSIFLRHCTVDPCWNSELPCIKKCCPLNEILDRDARQCRSPGEKSTYDILTAVTHETGNLWRDESSFTLVYGTGLKCVDDRIRQTTTSWPVVNGNGSFVNFEALIDSDRFTDQYCIDYIDANDTKKGYRALACMKLQPPVPENADQTLLVYPYLHIASVGFMLITLGVYSMLPELREVHGILVMCLVSSLTVLHSGLCIVSVFGKTMPDVPCIVNGAVTHFAFLSSNAWLNVAAFDVWLTFSRLGVIKRKRTLNKQYLGKIFVYYSLYGWGLPGVITLLGQLFDHIEDLPDYVIRPQFGVWSCWFFLQEAYLLYIHGPAAVMNIANICFFVASSVSLYHQPHPSSTGHNQEEVRAKQRLQMLFTLFVLMGIPWMTEIIMLYAAESFSAAVTDVFNILTGLVVFMLFVCKPNIVRLLCKRYPRFDRLVATISNQPFFKFITRNNSKCSEKPVKSTVKTSVNTSVNTEPRINDAARYEL